MENLAIFASGNGSNAQRIIDYFIKSDRVRVAVVLSNNTEAYVLKRAEQMHIPAAAFSREDFYGSDRIVELLRLHGISFIVLAGFLWLVPPNLLNAYPSKIVNIHPALLPGHGGKGMYGAKVHEAVISAGEKESGITIHYVNEKYDDGNILFQAKCEVAENETPESLAAKIHELEYRNYPEVIERVLLNF
jgi:phosphoribosylglycinamide formyltransferase-1